MSNEDVNIGQMTLKRYFNQNPRHLKPHERAGFKDGKNNKPSSESEQFSGYEKQLIAEARNAWARYQQRKNEQIESIKGKIATEEKMRDEGAIQEIGILENEQQQEQVALTNLEGPQSAKQNQLNRDHENSLHDKKELQILLNRPLQTKVEKVYLPFMLILAFLESPLNSLAFEMFFQGRLIWSFAIALAVGSIFIYFAHVGGEKLKETTCKELKQNKAARYILVIAISVFSLLVMWFIAQIRQDYIEQLGGQGGMTINDWLEQDGIAGTVKEKLFRWDLGIEGYLLLLANIAIYSVGLLASYNRHDSHPDYERAFTNEKKARYLRDQHEINYQKKFNKISDKSDKDINYKTRKLNENDQRIDKLKEREKIILASEEKNLKVCETGVNAEIVAYQKGNENSRTDSLPKYFVKLKVSPDDIMG